MFLTFNKVKQILTKGTCTESIVRKALSRSEVLELSDDQTKVRRKQEVVVKPPEEVDECTLYVEQVPINSTHESLKELFSRFGKVVYVSLPRYKKSRQLKQFAFVEFENKESIMEAINTFKRCDNVLQYAIVKAENLLSIATHDKDQDEKVDEKMDVDSKDAEKSEENLEAAETDEPPAKKLKVAEDDENPEESENEASKASEKETEDEGEKVEDDEGDKKKKKNRKHKKKPKSNSLVDEHVLAMKIMRKKDWKKMRNEYLNLERQKAKEIKKVLRDSYNKRNISKIQESQKFSPLNTAQSPRINFYGSPNDREDRFEATSESLDANQTSGGLNFIPGVIVNIKFREPCSDFKELKKEFKQFPYVNFVEILEGGSQCYIRVDNPNSAVELVGQYSSCEYETDVLKDEAEKEYWKKIFEKRDGKESKKGVKRVTRRRRGRERLVEKIQSVGIMAANAAPGTHLRFDEAIADDSMGIE